jgi:hypothetical protein
MALDMGRGKSRQVSAAFFEKKAAKERLIPLGRCRLDRNSPEDSKFFAELFFKKRPLTCL